ncbi:glycine cleavage system aminomethyltransferase GcvT [Listeria costaricensis]|uniref:glycine cleavage system aminomethyltransferase GcvT n=1 Tax=Listeria costaricensis TaxID=2026604 RepID=UPI000C07614F|nr:glycine cleavage system aminomethyltransferase GcvT [Listeria costaricensis]
MAELKKTPLHAVYSKYGAKTIDFGGWDLPVQFAGIKKEHEAVREQVGVFDVSHMGEIEVTGPDSTAYLQKMLTNDIAKIKDERAQYNIMCDENGGTVDDLVVYRRSEVSYLLVVNAANTEKDAAWLQQHIENEDVQVKDVSAMYGQLAVQGPKAEQILASLTEADLASIPFFGFLEDVELAGKRVLISRSGYTGEDGFEIYTQAADTVAIFEKLIQHGVEPIGLGARDTLRFEANLALYGQELSKEISPLEAKLNFAVKLQKEADFIGKTALLEQKEAGVPRQLVGIEMIDRGIPRHDYPVYFGEKQIGHVTSGTQSPTLGKNIGLALVETPFAKIGQELEIGVRHKKLKAVVIPTPFYKRSK